MLPIASQSPNNASNRANEASQNGSGVRSVDSASSPRVKDAANNAGHVRSEMEAELAKLSVRIAQARATIDEGLGAASFRASDEWMKLCNTHEELAATLAALPENPVATPSRSQRVDELTETIKSLDDQLIEARKEVDETMGSSHDVAAEKWIALCNSRRAASAERAALMES